MIRQRLFLGALLFFFAIATASAQEPIRFARTPDISPDGQFVAFTYLGDIWVVPTIGGVARHVTMHEKHEQNPVFSPDGKYLAFSSNRHGSYDVFVVPVQGGRPTRLTFDSADDLVTGWSPDGQHVLFTSSRGTDFPNRSEVYRVPMKGGRAVAITQHEGREGVYSPKGDQIAYVRGPGTWYRKGYRGSANDDIWICQADGSDPKQITHFNGQDHSPSWSPDGKFIYYVSEYHGTPANVVRQSLNNPKGEPEQLTFHKDEGVRRARLSGNGQWLVYECGPDLWVLCIKDGTFRKLAIEVNADDKTNLEKIVTFTAEATEFSLSHDESHMVFVVHGELFLMKASGGKAKRLTDNPAYDHAAGWSPDGKKIVFLSDRGGHEDIYLLESDDPDHAELHLANHFKVKQLTKTPELEEGVNFSPDGKRITFVRSGQLVSIDANGGDEKILVKDGMVIDYEWSPDGQWICYSRMDGSFASEMYIIPSGGATAADPARNVTRFATFNAGVTWSRTGNQLAFISQRKRGSQNAYVLSLQKPAAPGAGLAAAGKDIDWDDIHLRVRQPSTMEMFDCVISHDGTQIACCSQEGDLWIVSSDGSQSQRITTGGLRPMQIQWSRPSMGQVYFRDKFGNIRRASTSVYGTPTSLSSTIIPFQAKMTVRQEETFNEIFEMSWRALHDQFYDPAFHGANWNKIREKYRPLVKHCVMKEDLYVLVSLMLGELNASHLGISGKLSTPEEFTADLGLIFDPTHRGTGLKIAEIIKRGPADKRGLNLKPGDIVLSIDGVELTESLDTAKALNDKAGTVVTLLVTSNPADKKAKRRVDMVPTSRPVVANLMYERWTEKNAQRVAELSKGKLGYIHIAGMNQEGVDRFVRSLYSDNFDKEAIVIDVRYNGGGNTHDQILSYLGGKEHTYFVHRGGSVGAVINFNDRKFNKPLVVLINNRSYSDAEIFPHAFRTLGLGKVVGQSTGGFVIGTRNVMLIDGSMFRTPRTGVMTLKGVNMEKEGVMPDYPVDVHPNDLARGLDPQLDKAVEVLQQEVIAWKKNQTPGKGEAGVGQGVAAPEPARPIPGATPMPPGSRETSGRRSDD
jgi:tricorn protease